MGFTLPVAVSLFDDFIGGFLAQVCINSQVGQVNNRGKQYCQRNFINVLNTVDALNIDSKNNEEILKMMRDNNGIFNKGNIGSYIIFRDSLFNNNYYCTDEFVDFVKQNSITGLKFTCAGIAK